VSSLNCPDDHPVKGNISSRGHIFHVPSDPSYERTKPEQCFANVASAEAAGFRAPKS
jgi:micrococcal nuclease